MRTCLSLLTFSLLLLTPAIRAQNTPLVSDRAASRFLEQSSWGPTPVSIAQLQQQGFQNWLSAQFALNTSDIPDQPIQTAAMKPNNDLAPVESAFFTNTITGQDQLRQRVAFVLSQILVVAATELPNAYAYPPYWRVFRDNAFGNYRDILKAVTLNPAMGHYLNMANNHQANPATGTSANENYARELMQLFSIGLVQLRPDGTVVVDVNGVPVPTYNQAVVTQTAKALTGWTYPTAPRATAHTSNPDYYIGSMTPVEAFHDTTGKTIIGNIEVPSGQSAEKDLDSVLDALMAQSNMAPFISKQIIQHLVTSNPSSAYIQRISTVFTDNGSGVKGDMKAVIAAILTDPEARAADDAGSTPVSNFGHLREPILWVSSVLRGLNADPTAMNSIGNSASAMGEQLFNEPSVFSYFSPDNSIGPNLLGPEFEIYTTQNAANTANNVNAIVYGGTLGGTKADLTPFMNFGSNFGALMDYIDYVFLHRSMSDSLRQQAIIAATFATTPARAAQMALYIVLTSNEFNVIH